MFFPIEVKKFYRNIKKNFRYRMNIFRISIEGDFILKTIRGKYRSGHKKTAIADFFVFQC